MSRDRISVFTDWRVNRGDYRIQLALVLFRICHRLRRGKRKRDAVAGKVASLLYLVLVEWTWGIELPWMTEVGPALVIFHGTGLVVNGYSVLGASVILHQNVCIGTVSAKGGSPVLGDGVEVGANAMILGDVHIGEGARIGAGAVVLIDVPAGRTAVGNPARLVGSPRLL